jgi:phage shock protein PspC (stress-responsive transcriptional regulator)
VFESEQWHRSHAERRFAGVAAAIARPLAVPVGAVRLAFVLLTFVHLLGPLLYGALWLVIPRAPGEESLLDRGLARVRDAVAQLLGVRPPPGRSDTSPAPGDPRP